MSIICRFTEGIEGDTLLDLNDLSSYWLLDDSEFPLPEVVYSWVENSEGRRLADWHLLGDKIKLVLLIHGDSEDDAYTKLRVLMKRLLKENTLEVRPYGATGSVFYHTYPALPKLPQWNKKFVIDEGYITNITIEIPVDEKVRIARESLPVLENLAPNASFENWTGATIDDWTITVAGGSAITKGTVGTDDPVLDGSNSVKMVRSNGNCYYETTGYVTIDILDPFCLDDFVYSTAALGATIEARCYDSAKSYLATVAFTGNTRGGTAWDREVMYLYHAGTVPKYYIAASDWPATTAKIKIRISLNANGTIYVDKLMFANVRYVPDHAFDGVLGLRIFPEDIKGDLPALCDFYISNPFTSPPWKAQASGQTVDINGVHALDASHVYAVGDDGYIFFYNGVLWATQSSGVSVPLNGVSAKDSTHIWAVGANGTIRFSPDSATWAGQNYPANPDLLYALDGSFEWWSDPNTLTFWDYTPASSPWNFLLQSTDKIDGSSAARDIQNVGGGGTDHLATKSYININPMQAYQVSYWTHTRQDDMQIAVRLVFFDASSNVLGWSTGAINSPPVWYVQYIDLFQPPYPTGTVKCKVEFHLIARQSPPPPIGNRIWLDAATMQRYGNPNLNSVCAITSTNIIAVGQWGHIVKSADGTTWIEKTSGVTVNLNAVHAYDDSHWIAVGDNGTVLISANGETWTITELWPAWGNLYGVYALDATHAWAVGEDGTILFSADAGVTWTPQTSGTTKDLRSLYAFNSTNVWAVGFDGTLLFFNGTVWTMQNSGTSKDLNGISGLSATSVWAVGTTGTIIYGVYSAGALTITDLIIGQRDGYHASYNPVVETPALDTLGGALTLAYSPYRRWGTYRTMAAGKIVDFLFNLASHAGSQYMVTAGISFSATTAYDKGTLHLFLKTTGGTAITAQYITDEIDLGDPNTKWKEVVLQALRWARIRVPTYKVSGEAEFGNINQVAELIANASLAGVSVWLDYVAIIPTYRFVNVGSIDSNYLIIDSTLSYVLDSLDGGPSTAMIHNSTEVNGVPGFLANPVEGMNLTLVAINDVSNDQRVGMVNLRIEYYPCYLLVKSTES